MKKLILKSKLTKTKKEDIESICKLKILIGGTGLNPKLIGFIKI